MHQSVLNPSFMVTRKAKFAGVIRGREKFAFLYVLISAVVVPCAMTYSSLTGLGWKQTSLLLIGGLVGAWATVFSFLEVYRIGQTPQQRAAEILTEEADPYTSRTVTVQPPTGDPCPHHEDYPESAGFDQGQLTSRLTESTPLVEAFLSHRRREKQKAAR